MEASSTTCEISDNYQTRSNRASSASDHKEAILTCSICRKAVNSKKAKLLPCLHTLCSPCEITSSTEGRLTCLSCNQSCEATDIVDHFLVQNFDSGIEKAKCENCTENAIAKYKCFECGDNLCLECGRAHKRVKVTKDHHLNEIDFGSSSTDGKCPSHPQEDLSWFCMTCNKITCRNCQLECHSGHQYRSLEEHTQGYRTEMKKIIEDNRKKLTNLSQIINLSDQRIKEVTTSENNMRTELSNAVKQIQQALTERGKYLLNKIETASGAKRHTYNDVKTAAENIEAMSKQVIYFIEAAFMGNNKHTILRSLQLVTSALNRIEKLKQERRSAVNILQMQVQLSINLQCADVVERIKNMGDLVMDRISQIPASSMPATAHQGIAPTSATPPTNNITTGLHSSNCAAQQGIRHNQSQTSTTAYRAMSSVPQVGASAVPTLSMPAPGMQQYHMNRFTSNPNAYIQRNQMPGGPSIMSGQQPRQQMQLRPNTSQSCHISPQQSTRFIVNQLQQMVQAESNQIQPQTAYQTIPHPYQNVYQNDPRMFVPQNSAANLQSCSQPGQFCVSAPNFQNQQQQQASQAVSRHPNSSLAGQLQQPSRLQQPPRLQYGPAMQNPNQNPNSTRIPMIQMLRTQAPPPNSPTAVQLQRASSPVQVANLLHGSNHQMKVTTGQQHNLSSLVSTALPQSAKRRSSGDQIGETISPIHKNRVLGPTIHLSPSPEPPKDAYMSDNQDLAAKAPEQNLVITNVISINKQSKNSISPKPEQKEDVSCTVPKTEVKDDSPPEHPKTLLTTNDVSSTSVSRKKSEGFDTASDRSNSEKSPNNFIAPPVTIKTSRLARKSISRPLEKANEKLNVNLTNKPENNTCNLSNGLAENTYEDSKKLMDNGNEISSGSMGNGCENSKSPNMDDILADLNDFPMTQAFVPMMDDDDEAILGSSVKKHNVTALVITDVPVQIMEKNDDNVANGNNSDKRETPDASEVTTTTDDNRWEDYCSVCQNGGDLMCCEAKGCTRVFHIYDHIPQYTETPKDQWFCNFCININDFKSDEDNIPFDERNSPHLTPFEQKACERILLTLYCHPDSEPFHNPVERGFDDYYRTIKHPIDFSVIRAKLNASIGAENRYLSVEGFLGDLNRVFINCSIFNDPSSDTGKAGKIVGAKYMDLVNEYFPNLVHMVQITKGKRRSRSSLERKRKRRRLELPSESDDSSSCSSRHSSPFVKII